MSFLAIGVGVTGAAVSAGTQSINNARNRKAEKEGRQRAIIDANMQDYQARKAEQFDKTEGQGIGTFGEINMQVDNQTGNGTIKDTLGLTL